MEFTAPECPYKGKLDQLELKLAEIEKLVQQAAAAVLEIKEIIVEESKHD
jgi:hypothetical protein